jgi:aryl-alcohol dehydrogenase-like predicted oxidoreductase
MRPDDPNGGGAHRKSLVQSLEASLRRLGTDYLDLYWVHIWDAFTPVEEVVRALDDVVSAGKVLYVGISDTPAWIVAQAVTLADAAGAASPACKCPIAWSSAASSGTCCRWPRPWS